MDQLATDPTKRILKVTAGNLRQNHIYVRGHADFFPPDSVGPARGRRDVGAERAIEIYLDGLNESIRTDIASDAQTGRSRGFFRRRDWVKRFFDHHHVEAGAELALERLGKRRYRLSVQNGSHPTACEFFAGIGLVRLALERQGWKVVFANDIDPDKAEMYRHNWPKDDHLLVGDIHDIDPAMVPTCDLFTASFPCNDLSIAGRWEGLGGKESSAYWGFIDIVRGMKYRRPRLILIENVVGFLLSNSGRDFEQALRALNELDYSVDAVILNAVHWVPQSRARLFVIARLGCQEERRSFPWVSDARPQMLCDFIAAHQDIRWDLAEVPSLPKPSRTLADIVEDLPDDDPRWWDEQRVAYFMGQMSIRHAAEARRMIDGKKITFATAFRRVRRSRSMAELRTDGNAGCLRTPRGGSAKQILVRAGRKRLRVRHLTSRECARLQGVPDPFLISVTEYKALFGFGDAVCVPVIEWIAGQNLNRIAQGCRDADS